MAPTPRRAPPTAELEDAGTVAALVAASDVVLSVCPPHAALDIARAVAAPGSAGSTWTATRWRPTPRARSRSIVQAAGATYVDGGIIGPPPDKPGTTRLYLSGPAAERIAALFAPGPLEAVVLAGDLTAASAIKMAYAAWTKGSQALIMDVRALATAEGVDEALLAEWQRSQPDLPKRSENAAKGTARKAWRWVGEMDEIAATFAAAGLPDGFHRGGQRALPPHGDLQGRGGAAVDGGRRQDTAQGAGRMSVTMRPTDPGSDGLAGRGARRARPTGSASLTPAEIDELDAALRAVQRRGLGLARR